MIKVNFYEDGHYPIEVLLPQKDLTLEEAKELVARLQAGIYIAEWDSKKETITEKTHWSQDYLESFNDDGSSVD